MKIPAQKKWMVFTTKLGVVVILIGACVWAWQQVYNEKIAMYQAQKAVNELPEQISGQAALKSDLERHEHDINRFRAFTPTRDGISEFVSRLEEESKKHSLTLSVTDITEGQKLDDQGLPIPISGPLNEVRMTGTAYGQPQELISFLFTLEHMPYLVRVIDWHLQAISTGGTTAAARIPTTSKEQTSVVPGQLLFTLGLTVRYE